MRNRQRNPNNLPLRKRILILCEGVETEKRYFNSIRFERSKRDDLPKLTIEVDAPANTSKKLIKVAVERKVNAANEGWPYERVWIVVDKNGYTQHREAFELAKTEGIEIAFSSISFEYWFLLHFKKAENYFPKADALIKHLKRNGYPNYRKNIDHYAFLKGYTIVAVSNSRFVRKKLNHGNMKPIYDRNPYTDVDILVCYLLDLK